MSIRIYSFLLAVFLTSGCAQTSKQQPVEQVTQAAVEENVVQAAAVPVQEEKKYDKLPPDLLFMLLTAEIAGQRGNINVAIEGYMQALKLSRDPAIAERATQIALFSKDLNAAGMTVEEWVERDPESGVAHKIATMVALQQGDGASAAEHLKRLIETEDIDPEDMMLEVVKVLSKQGPEGVTVMQNLVAEMPEMAEAHYAYALLLNNTDDGRAMAEVEKALSLKPNWVRAKVLQVQLISDAGDNERAQKILKAELSKDPKNVVLRLIYAQLLVKQGEYESAESEFAHILDEDSEQQDARYALALVKLQLGERGEAKTLFLELLDDPKWQKHAYLNLGRLSQLSGDANTALAWFDRIPPGPLFFDAQMAAMAVLAEEGRMATAIHRLEELRVQYPAQAVRIYLMEVELLNEQKDYQAVFKTLNQALEEYPDRAELLYARALAAERLDKLDVLEADLKAVLSATPDDPHALNALGYTLVDRTDRYQEAQGYLEKAIELRPDDPVIMDSYGWLHYRLGEYEEALALLQKAYDLHNDPEIAAHLVEVLWVLDKKDDARTLLGKTEENFPESEYIQELKQRLPAINQP